MGVALLGSVKVPLARRLQIDEARVGGLVSVFGFALIPVMPTAGLITDLVGKQAVLMAGSLLIAASLGVLALAAFEDESGADREQQADGQGDRGGAAP